MADQYKFSASLTSWLWLLSKLIMVPNYDKIEAEKLVHCLHNKVYSYSAASIVKWRDGQIWVYYNLQIVYVYKAKVKY